MGGKTEMDISDKQVELLKAFTDPNRLRIIDMLSCGEMCACRILEHFKITQPTLSHHMKILIDCGLVDGLKDGVWMRYSLNRGNIDGLLHFLGDLTSDKVDCICIDKEQI